MFRRPKSSILNSWDTSSPTVIGVDLQCFRQFDLQVIVLAHTIFHDHAVEPDLQVTTIGVDDDVHVGFFAKAAPYHATEDILQDAHHGHTVDVLEVLEFPEGFDEVHSAHSTIN